MKGLGEVLAKHVGGCGRLGLTCADTRPRDEWCWRCDLTACIEADVLAWVAAGLDGLRDDVWEWLPYSKIPEASDADAVLDIIRGALGVPQEATGADLSDEGRSVGFGDGSDDEGGLE